MHGYEGETRPAAVRYEGSRERHASWPLQIGAESVAPLGTPVPGGANVLEVREARRALPRSCSARPQATRCGFV